MMYQFQRSFIKAASEFVVGGTGLKEEPNLQVTEHNPCPTASPLTSRSFSPGKQNENRETRGMVQFGTEPDEKEAQVVPGSGELAGACSSALL